MKNTLAFGLLALASSTVAHPGESAEEHARGILERREYLANNKRSLAHCADALEARGNNVAMHTRRAATVASLRKKRGLTQEADRLNKRDLDTALNTSHHSNLTVDLNTSPSVLFSSNNSCLLTPEVTQGPYYVSGELVRSDVTESQEGVSLVLDIQLIDVSTCQPVPQAFLEIWHCNSTGVYSGVVANGNGNSDDTSNLNATFLRGVQETDSDGVVQFETLVPGHYTGRATHIHVLATRDATVNSNDTLSGGSVTHVGQMFVDQSLITEVEKVEPYASNTQDLTLNADDSILAEEAEDVDPFINYVLLGDSVEEGIFGWLAFGVDMSNSFNITPAAYLTDHGGVENENSMGGGPGGSPPGAMPSGAMPTNMTSNATATSTILPLTVSSSGASLSRRVWRW